MLKFNDGWTEEYISKLNSISLNLQKDMYLVYNRYFDDYTGVSKKKQLKIDLESVRDKYIDDYEKELEKLNEKILQTVKDSYDNEDGTEGKDSDVKLADTDSPFKTIIDEYIKSYLVSYDLMLEKFDEEAKKWQS